MDLGKIIVEGTRDGSGNVGASMKMQGSNLSVHNQRAFDADQKVKLSELRKAVNEAAAAYFAYTNRPSEEVREESSIIIPGVNAPQREAESYAASKAPAPVSRSKKKEKEDA